MQPFTIDNITNFVKGHPGAQRRYRNTYHTLAISSLFKHFVKQEKIGVELLPDIDAALVAIQFLAFADPSEAYNEYITSRGTKPSLSQVYFILMLGKINERHTSNPVTLCLFDAVLLKDMSENDAIHILENYRTEEMQKESTIPPGYQTAVRLLKQQLHSLTLHTTAGKTFYHQRLNHYIDTLQRYADLKEPIMA